MSLNLNELIVAFTKADIEYKDIFKITIPEGGKSEHGTTSPGVCGLVIPWKGRARFELGGENYELEPGILMHAGAGVELYKEVLGNSEWSFILLHYQVNGDETVKGFLETTNFVVDIGSNRNQELDLLLQKLIKFKKENSPLSEFRCKSILFQIVELILILISEKMLDTKEELIEYMISYIHNNLDKSLSISQLADMIGIDSKQFHYMFLKRMNMCPKKYITKCKIKRAKDLLEDNNYTVGMVAEMVGYEDALHFSRVFKKNTGVSPSHYRENFVKNPWRI